VKLSPALLPAGLDRLGGDVGKGGADPGLALLVGVGDQPPLRLLEALGMELEEDRPRLFERVRRDCDGDPAEDVEGQRNALFSLSKNPSSGR
jgi:hypothetical protein